MRAISEAAMRTQNQTQWQEIYARVSTLEAEIQQLRSLLSALHPAEKVAHADEQKRRAIAAAGRFSSDVTDLAAAHDHYLAEAYQA
jgi:hypothetical protein